MKTYLPLMAVTLAASPLMTHAQSAAATAVPRGSSPPVPGSVSRVEVLPAGTPVEMTRLPDGFARMGGTVYIVENGVPTAVEGERVMRVSADGTVTNFDGRTWIIPAEQIVTRDGRTVPITTTLRDSRAAESALRPSNENANNYSGLAPTTTTGGTAATGSSTSAGSSSSSAQGSGGSVPFTGGQRTTNPNAYPASQSPTPNRNNGSNAPVVLDSAGTPFGFNSGAAYQNNGNMNNNGTGTNNNGTGTNNNGTGTNANGTGTNNNGTGTNANGTGSNANGTGTNNNGTGTNANGSGSNMGTGTNSGTGTGVNAGAGINAGAGVSTGNGSNTSTTNPNARSTGTGSTATGTQGTNSGTTNPNARPAGTGNTGSNTGTGTSTGSSGSSSTGGSSTSGGSSGTSGGSAGGGGGSSAGGGASAGGGR